VSWYNITFSSSIKLTLTTKKGWSIYYWGYWHSRLRLSFRS